MLHKRVAHAAKQQHVLFFYAHANGVQDIWKKLKVHTYSTLVELVYIHTCGKSPNCVYIHIYTRDIHMYVPCLLPPYLGYIFQPPVQWWLQAIWCISI